MVKVGVGGSWAWIISFVGPLLFLQVFHFSQRGMGGGRSLRIWGVFRKQERFVLDRARYGLLIERC